MHALVGLLGLKKWWIRKLMIEGIGDCQTLYYQGDGGSFNQDQCAVGV